jgi:hypothetical protein
MKRLLFPAITFFVAQVITQHPDDDLKLYEQDISNQLVKGDQLKGSNPMPMLQRNYMPFIDHIPKEFQDDMRALISNEAAYFTID